MKDPTGPWAAALCGCAALLAAAGSAAQTVSERVLGTLVLTGTPRPGVVVARDGQQMARPESVAGGGERYVTFGGAGPTFDRITPGAAWIDNRLVYLAVRGGQSILVDGSRQWVLKGRATSPQVLARNWPSQDRRHYLSFVTDGKTVGWLLDGKPQAARFDRLGLVDIAQPRGTPWFAAATGCQWRLVGHAPSAGVRWDLLRWVRATATGDHAFAHGDRAGESLLHRDGKVVWREPVWSFAASPDGSTWMAVVDRSVEGADRVALLRNGQVVDQADVDLGRQRLVVSADGTAWVWEVVDADYNGSTYRRPGMEPVHVTTPTRELVLSPDGRRLGAVRPSADRPGQVDVIVDGRTVATADSVRAQTLQLDAHAAFSVVVTSGGQVSVVTQAGSGPAFDEVSLVSMLADGRPAYVARRGADNFAVRGSGVVRLPVDDAHHLTSLRLEADALRVLGTRGTEVVDLTISD